MAERTRTRPGWTAEWRVLKVQGRSAGRVADTIGDLIAGLAGSMTGGALYRRLTTAGRTP